MLIKFTVKNFLSFMEEASLDLEAGSIREFPKNVFTGTRGTQDIKLLKNVTLFGGNSSGKTNFLRAFATMRYWVVKGYSDTTEGKKIPVKPFLLNTVSENQPTHFEVSFLIRQTGYRYGFIADKDKIHQEWLFVTTKRKEENVFIRVEGDYQVDRRFQSDQKQELNFLMKFTKPAALFLTILSQFNGGYAQEIMNWFLSHRMYMDNRLDEDIHITASLLLEKPYRGLIYEIIKKSDLGFATVKEELDDSNKAPTRRQNVYNALNEEILKKYKIKTKHEKFNSAFEVRDTLYFDLEEEESAGAKKFIALLGPVVRALVDGEIIWIDELDARLHTLLVNLIVSLINSSRYNTKGCQAIITTHNIQVFKKLRRDQMFTLEKTNYGISAMSSVYVGKPNVRGDANMDKEYLNETLGGIPRIDKQLFLDFDREPE